MVCENPQEETRPKNTSIRNHEADRSGTRGVQAPRSRLHHPLRSKIDVFFVYFARNFLTGLQTRPLLG